MKENKLFLIKEYGDRSEVQHQFKRESSERNWDKIPKNKPESKFQLRRPKLREGKGMELKMVCAT